MGLTPFLCEITFVRCGDTYIYAHIAIHQVKNVLTYSNSFSGVMLNFFMTFSKMDIMNDKKFTYMYYMFTKTKLRVCR